MAVHPYPRRNNLLAHAAHGPAEPAQPNANAFNMAVEEIAHISRHLLEDLLSGAPPKNRVVESEKAKAR